MALLAGAGRNQIPDGLVPSQTLAPYPIELQEAAGTETAQKRFPSWHPPAHLGEKMASTFAKTSEVSFSSLFPRGYSYPFCWFLAPQPAPETAKFCV